MSFKNSKINIYDSTGFTELFEIKNEVGKVSMTSEVAQEVNATSLVFNKTDALGAVIDSVPDVVAAINSGAGAITQEVTDRQAADTALQANIDAEEAARIAADGVIQTALDAEVTQRTGEVAFLVNAFNTADTAINNEATIRQGADDNLQAIITAEGVTRLNADNALQVNINAEAARIDGILAGADVNLDSFTELVTFINGLDATQLALITTLQTDTAQLRADHASHDALRAEFDAAFPGAPGP